MNLHNPVLVGIVVYNTPPEILQRTLESLSATSIPITIAILCNSQENSYQKLIEPICKQWKALFQLAKENRGFGAGHNEIWQTFKSQWYICCNPDVLVAPDTIEKLISYGESNPQAALLMPKVLNTDGTVQPLARKHPTLWQWSLRQMWRIFPNKIKPYEMLFDYSKTQPIEFLSGCFFAVRTTLMEQLKGFDERFFLYAEDADLSRRASKLGVNVYIADASVKHVWSKSWQTNTRSFFQHLGSLFLYWRIHGLLHPIPTPPPLTWGRRCSIAMCTYNGAAYLKAQIDSILPQLQPQDEVVIGDDGSIDGTLDILKAYADKDKRLKILPKSSERLGVINNFQRVLKECSGDIIFLSDQDDVWLPHKRIAIEKEFVLDPTLWIVVSEANIIDSLGNILTHSFLKSSKKNHFTFFSSFKRNGFLGSAMAFRKELLEMGLPFPKKTPMHDWWLGMLCLSIRRKIKFMEEPLIHYRRHLNNASPQKRRHWTVVALDRIELAKNLMGRWLTLVIKGGN